MGRIRLRPDFSQKPIWFWAVYGALTWGATMFVLFGLIIDQAHHWVIDLLTWLSGGALWGVATVMLMRRRLARKR